MKPGAGRLTGWFALASLVCVAAAGFVFLANLEDPPRFLGTGPFKVTVDSDEGDEGPIVRDDPEIEIPAIGVSSKVIELEKNSDGTLETPTDYHRGRLVGGRPHPGAARRGGRHRARGLRARRSRGVRPAR